MASHGLGVQVMQNAFFYKASHQVFKNIKEMTLIQDHDIM